MQTTIQKYTTEYVGSSLKFSSPYRKSWLIILGLSWVVITASVILLSPFLKVLIPEIASILAGFPLPLFLVLLPSGVLAFVELLWQLCGVEIAEVSEDQITLKHQILGLGISKSLLAQNIDAVFVSNHANDWLAYARRELKFLNFKKGTIAINYGKTLLGGVRTYRFGSSLEKEEAKEIVVLIHERFPQYKYRDRRKAG